MTLFPPIPSWDGLHPLVVQFAIALLMVAPLLVLVDLFIRRERTWAHIGLLLMVLGTIATWLATGTGHAGATLIERARNLGGLVSQHEQVGLLTRNLFTVLTVLFAGLLLYPAMAKKAMPRSATITVQAILLVLYVGTTVVLGNAAWRGARLVHEYGVHAVVPGPAPGSSGPVAGR